LFYFDAWSSKDDYVSPSELKYHWDFDGDGYWDTQFSHEMVMHHQFAQPGEYTVTLEAIDPGGEKGKTTQKITVSPYSNETSYFVDSRDQQIYGTVKIGDQWWMAENLRYYVPQKQSTGLYTWLCLMEQDYWCKEVGKMYHASAITENRGDSEYLEVCPNGWHLPSQNEFEKLFLAIGGEDKVNQLALGGSQDFNAKYMGYADYYFIMLNMFTIKDTVYEFHESFKSFYLTSSTIPEDINNIRSGVWMMSFNQATGELWKGFHNAKIYVPVRCIRDN
ncbi:MAG: PKD domain-containing protein, partial [Bacteroidales bacterium]|nr:PKD domain-containing protein [Bacteroidales bacterium]